MKKKLKLFVLLFVSVFHTSCGQNQTNAPKKNIKSETKDTATSYRPNNADFHSKYEYTDSMSKRVIIQNSFPKGGGYIGPDGKRYPYTVYYTQITNETMNPVELKINFPIDSFEFPLSSGNYMKLFIPSDTMTLDKVSLYDYGLSIKSFFDTGIKKSYSMNRTVNPKESTAFYVVIRSNKGVDGALRTGLSLKGQNLFYRIKVDGSKNNTKSIDKEIICGSINLNLK
jgi:hypothetical protein